MSEQAQRGRCAFDARRLERQLAEQGGQPDFDEYLRFYVLPGGDAHAAEVLDVEIDGDFERIVLQRFTPEKPRAWALFHHGYYDHVGLFRHVFEYLLAHGVGVYAFDQLGHGLSSGPRATITSFDRYVDVIEAVVDHIGSVDSPIHLIGQSMGGALLLEFLQRHPRREVGELVLFAPLVRPYAWSLNRIYFHVVKHLISERPRTIMANASNEEFLHLQHNDPLQARVLPVQWVQAMVDWFRVFERYPVSERAPKIIQGHQDRTISWRHSVKVLSKRYPQAQWLHIAQASHHLANESDEVRARMFDWLDARCSWTRIIDA